MADNRLDELMNKAYEDNAVPKLYANGFALGLTNADMWLGLALQSRPTAIVHMSYTLAKTLHSRLGQMLADFEARTERKMLRIEEVEAAFTEKK